MKDAYLPNSGLWVSEYPHTDRTQFLEVSLQVEREGLAEAEAAAAAAAAAAGPAAQQQQQQYGGGSGGQGGWPTGGGDGYAPY